MKLIPSGLFATTPFDPYFLKKLSVFITSSHSSQHKPSSLSDSRICTPHNSVLFSQYVQKSVRHIIQCCSPNMFKNLYATEFTVVLPICTEICTPHNSVVHRYVPICSEICTPWNSALCSDLHVEMYRNTRSTPKYSDTISHSIICERRFNTVHSVRYFCTF